MEMPLRKSTAAYVANKLTRHALVAKTVMDTEICCEDCKMLAVMPVTSPCGHTRCTKCVESQPECECGYRDLSKNLHTNILVRDIVEKMHYRRPLPKSRVSSSMFQPADTEFTLMPTTPGRVKKYAMRSRLLKKPYKGYEDHKWTRYIALRRLATTPDYRLKYAQRLLHSGRYRDAAAHLAQAAASSSSVSKIARALLIEVIEILCPSDPKRLIRSMYKSVRFEMPTSWIDNSNIECPVCYNFMEEAVTTTCGHTFCRLCITRILVDRRVCPLCSSDLTSFDAVVTENTHMVSALVRAISNNSLDEPEITPVFNCTMAFPDVICPLMILDPEYNRGVRSALNKGLRRFGLFASDDEDDTCSVYGTMVDVHDYIELENGNCILSTVGVSRFRILNKAIIRGCPYARIQHHTDNKPSSETISDLQRLLQEIKVKAQGWLLSLDRTIYDDMQDHFGPPPEMSLEGEWWYNPNGPSWLWWLIAILPLRPEIQMLMVSANELSKRMNAVLRTLDFMDRFSSSLFLVREQ